jgi:Ca-activated chloride channel homolog
MLYQSVQQAKRSASSRLSAGDVSAALAEIRNAQEVVRAALLADPPPPLAADLVEEGHTLDYLADQIDRGMTARAAKYSSMNSSHKSSKRGRPLAPPPGHATDSDPSGPST